MSKDTEIDAIVSRTQKKREATAAQDLGERLLDIPNKQLMSLDLPDNLVEAVQTARGIKAFGGRKRQLQYIGKIMRGIELDAIEEFFFQLDNKNIRANANFKKIENWRDRLINEGNGAIEAFQFNYFHVDVKKMRQLIRNVNQKKNEKLALRSRRAIFQYIKDVIGE